MTGAALFRSSRAGRRDPALKPLRVEAAELFSAVHPTDNWVWKDPRNSLLLPFWRRVLDVSPVAILVHRNPLEVAASLLARDDFGTHFSLALWERYIRAALIALEGLPCLVLDYASLLAEPIASSRRLGEFLVDSEVAAATLEADASTLEFVDPSLRHAAFGEDHVLTNAVVSAEQRELFRVAREAEGISRVFSVPSLPAETRSTEALLAERRYALALELRYSELEAFACSLAERLMVAEKHPGSAEL